MTCLQDNVSLPFTTTVLDSAVEVIGFEDGACGGLVAICRRGRSRQRIPLADLPLPTPAVADHAWIHAYGPHCVRAYPSGFVVVRLNLQADSGVGGSAAPKHGAGAARTPRGIVAGGARAAFCSRGLALRCAQSPPATPPSHSPGKVHVTTQGLRPYGPHCVRTCPSGFVVVRLNLPADSGVGGSAAPKRIRPSPLGARPHRVRWGRELRAL